MTALFDEVWDIRTMDFHAQAGDAGLSQRGDAGAA